MDDLKKQVSDLKKENKELKQHNKFLEERLEKSYDKNFDLRQENIKKMPMIKEEKNKWQEGNPNYIFSLKNFIMKTVIPPPSRRWRMGYN